MDENRDFENFLNDIMEDIKVGKVKSRYDEVYEDEDLARLKFKETLVTPFGQYTPRKLDILSLEQLKTAVHEYFSNLEEEDFLAKVPHEKLKM